ncbi:MAG: M20/M25/M40 family metallo-hydrolase [Gemmatimonadaceae bacterium]|nr:M20/M25/M40 family metallo-hydrolase [Gemmatimonadaceae bacterium]
MNDVVSLAEALVAAPSLTGAEGPAVELAARWLAERGWNVRLQELSPGRANIWASRGAGAVTLSTHLDTVPPFIGPTRDGIRLSGRGACDAKGIAAAMMVAAKSLADDGEQRVDLLFVVDEERSSDGARAANTLPATSRFLINGEPTEGRLASGAKGSMAVTVRTHGRAAHSAYPELGASAIAPMLALLSTLAELELPTDPVLGDTTINVGTLNAGREANIVPDEAVAQLMVRLVGDPGDVRAILQRWSLGRAELEFAPHIPAQHFHTIAGFECGPVSYTSDIPLLDRWGTPLLFGPGSITVAHTPHESIGIDELHSAVGSYVRLVRTLLAS